MTKLTKEFMQDIISGNGFGVAPSAVADMARQLLALMEQEPVGFEVITSSGEIMTLCKIESGKSYEDMNCTLKPVYSAPQLPQPGVVDYEQSKRLFDEWSGGDAALGELRSNGVPDEFISMLKDFSLATWEACREAMVKQPAKFIVTSDERMMEIPATNDIDAVAAMLQGAEPVHDVDNTNRQFESLGCAEDTARRFKCTGLIVTSDERKMEPPCCSKHQGTELQVHPFEQLMSYPPIPVMYCPLCKPSVAEWAAMDKQLRRQRSEK